MTIDQSKIFDVIIIGGGVAGISAAMWCDELGMNAVLLESAPELGGQLLWTHNSIKNYLGIEVENGRDLRDVFVAQLSSRRFSLKTDCEVTGADFANKNVYLNDETTFEAKAIIIAVGIRRRKLGIEGEDSFRGRGVLRSGQVDRDSVRNKKVYVVGGGDAAFENALILADRAAEVVLVHRGDRFRARTEFAEKAASHQKIRLLTNTLVDKLIGHENLEALQLKDRLTGEIRRAETDAILIRIGVEPNTDVFKRKLDTDDRKYIIVDASSETSAENVFAVGDVANPVSPTISSAAGMAVTAVKVIHGRLFNN